MKAVILIALLFWIFTNPDYTFDYRLEYDLIYQEDNSTTQVNYYINSRNNSFYADVRVKKNTEYNFYFRDQDKLTAQVNISGDYKNPGIVTLPDSLTVKFNNSLKYKAKNYDVNVLNDTVISGKQYTQVLIKLIDEKKAKKKKIGNHLYIIDTSKKIKPLLTDPTILNIWRLKNKIPDGVIVEKLVYNSEKKLIWKEKLNEISPINFKLFIKSR